MRFAIEVYVTMNDNQIRRSTKVYCFNVRSKTRLSQQWRRSNTEFGHDGNDIGAGRKTHLALDPVNKIEVPRTKFDSPLPKNAKPRRLLWVRCILTRAAARYIIFELEFFGYTDMKNKKK